MARRGICDGDELTQRLLEDGVDLEPEAVDTALRWLEEGSHPRYRARCYPPIRQRSQFDPHPPERWVLEHVRQGNPELPLPGYWIPPQVHVE
jgi:hypothetical protein